MSLKALAHIVVNLFRALAGAYGLSVSGFIGLRLLLGESWPLLGFLSNFLHLLLLPALLFLPLLALPLLLKRRAAAWSIALPLAATQLVPALTFLLTYGAQFLPRAHSSSPAITVLTYNLHAERADLSGMIAVMRASGADVIAVQELSVFAAAGLPPALRDLYPYSALYPGTTNPTHGQGIFSRHPIVAETYWQNTHLRATMGHLRALIDFDGRRLVFYNTHPVHPGMVGSFYDDSVRGAEIDIVLQRAAGESVPVVMLGDFNMGEWSEDYARITARHTDVYRAVGYGFGLTFPEWSRADTLPGFRARPLPLPPLLRLDYVFVSGLLPLEAQVWPDAGGSDHYPLRVQLGLADD
ncbi:MAG: endonuclease/exonuclease/phosphatase family protein [Chloroflexi bacterium]|nr:endonuclease/exonuclease/phosphatase family protein [Chloroflexota bacterium]